MATSTRVELFRAYLIWSATLTMISVYWIGAESAQSGQQYPGIEYLTLYCSLIFGFPLYGADVVVREERRLRRARNALAAESCNAPHTERPER